MKQKTAFTLLAAALLVAMNVSVAQAVSGAAFTTFNAHVDGTSKDVCKNSAINCNIYGAKEYVWLNGGPTANGLRPAGQYFFAVLAPGGQPDPNDGGAKNLSDDYDTYKNRTFTVGDSGEVVSYSGYPGELPHWLDSGAGGAKPNGKPPYIRLFPYADTPNPGGVYIMAICHIGSDGTKYPVEPRDCKYDAFKVKPKLVIEFRLEGMKFKDVYADGVKDSADPGLPGWTILITGTGPDGLPISASVTTDASGYWTYHSPTYTFPANGNIKDVTLKVCEALPVGWTQSYPPTPDGCHTITFKPTGFNAFFGLDFGNYELVKVKGCKVRDLDGKLGGDVVPVAGWNITLTKNGAPFDTKPTGSDGCVTWTGLKPGIAYDLHEEIKPGWTALTPTDYVFEKAKSGGCYEYTFVNYPPPPEGCTPGFWQGGNDFGTAGGKWLWNEVSDPQWKGSGGVGANPYIWTTLFNDFFTPVKGLAGFDMMSLVGTGGGENDYRKAARSLVAAYLNTSWGLSYPYSTSELKSMWTTAVNTKSFLALHTTLDAANNAVGPNGSHCPISARVY